MLLSDVDICLNRAAGRFADEAAARVQVSDHDVAATSQADLLAAEVLKRQFAIQREVLFSSQRELRVPRAPRRERGQSTSFAERDSGHIPGARKAATHCSQCASSFSLRGMLCEFWPDPCKPRCVKQQRVQLLPRRPVVERFAPDLAPDPVPDDSGPSGLCGSACDHPLADRCEPSHHLAVYGGVFFLRRAGVSAPLCLPARCARRPPKLGTRCCRGSEEASPHSREPAPPT